MTGKVSVYMAAPRREDCLHAVSLAFGKVRASGIKYCEIAKTLKVSPDTIENAATGKGSLLSFDTIAEAWFLWPEQFEDVAHLWEPSREAISPVQRLDRIDRDLAAVRSAINGSQP